MNVVDEVTAAYAWLRSRSAWRGRIYYDGFTVPPLYSNADKLLHDARPAPSFLNFIRNIWPRPPVLPYPSFPSGPLFKPPCLLDCSCMFSLLSSSSLTLQLSNFLLYFLPPILGRKRNSPSSHIPPPFLFPSCFPPRLKRFPALLPLLVKVVQ